MSPLLQTIAAALMEAEEYIGTDVAADRERAIHTRVALELADALQGNTLLQPADRLEFLEACGVPTPYGGWDHDGHPDSDHG